MAALVIGLLMGLALVFLAMMFFMGALAGESEKAKKNAPTLLDGTFDGRPVATWRVVFGSLDQKDVIEGAAARGYRMTGSTQEGRVGATTLVFEKQQ